MDTSCEQLLLDFETAFGCKLTLHDPLHLFNQSDARMQLSACRMSHRKTYPALCGCEDRDYCINTCMFAFNRRAEQTRSPILFKHCRNGFWEIAVPLFRHDVHVMSLFAGLWTSVTQPDDLRRIIRMLPIFANGIFKRLEELQVQQSHRQLPIQQRILTFIAGNYNKPLQTVSLAHHLSLSLSRTCALVKAKCGVSFKVLLTRERIRHAKLYLTQSDLRIKEIALLCGFASPEHFIRMFRTETDCSPSDWRERNRFSHLEP